MNFWIWGKFRGSKCHSHGHTPGVWNSPHQIVNSKNMGGSALITFWNSWQEEFHSGMLAIKQACKCWYFCSTWLSICSKLSLYLPFGCSEIGPESIISVKSITKCIQIVSPGNCVLLPFFLFLGYFTITEKRFLIWIQLQLKSEWTHHQIELIRQWLICIMFIHEPKLDVRMIPSPTFNCSEDCFFKPAYRNDQRKIISGLSSVHSPNSIAFPLETREVTVVLLP